MKAVVAGILWISMTGRMFCQMPAAQAVFEVASVKQSRPGTPGLLTRYLPDGSVHLTGATFKALVGIAFGVRMSQISGGPAWIDTERFDVDAQPAIPSPASTAGERLRNLLADRFQLALHHETKEQPVYELVVAKGGLRLHESGVGNTFIRKAAGTITGQAVGLRMLVINLSSELDSQVTDKTGLTGNYDFELRWMPIAPSVDQPPTDPDRPSIFAALTEQLGLRLEARKGPVEVLVIDRAERPSGN